MDINYSDIDRAVPGDSKLDPHSTAEARQRHSHGDDELDGAEDPLGELLLNSKHFIDT